MLLTQSNLCYFNVNNQNIINFWKVGDPRFSWGKCFIKQSTYMRRKRIKDTVTWKLQNKKQKTSAEWKKLWPVCLCTKLIVRMLPLKQSKHDIVFQASRCSVNLKIIFLSMSFEKDTFESNINILCHNNINQYS